MEENNRLQKIRKETIPDLITKYQKLVDNIFTKASSELPKFIDFKDEESGEVKVSAEQQYYSFIGIRESALNTADRMLAKINDLEREMYDPDYNTDEKIEEVTTTNTAKKYAKKG